MALCTVVCPVLHCALLCALLNKMQYYSQNCLKAPKTSGNGDEIGHDSKSSPLVEIHDHQRQSRVLAYTGLGFITNPSSVLKYGMCRQVCKSH